MGKEILLKTIAYVLILLGAILTFVGIFTYVTLPLPRYIPNIVIGLCLFGLGVYIKSFAERKEIIVKPKETYRKEKEE